MSWSHTYNITKSIAAFPCAQPNPIIIALTLVPAIAPALLEWASFGCRDILKFRLGKGAPCGRAMRAQVAKAVPPSLVNVVQKLMKWEHHFSFAGQMFLLSDLAADTTARWTTLAYQMSGCPDALDGAAWQVQQGAPEALIPNVPTVLGGIIVNETGRPGIAWPTGAIVPSDWYVSVEFSATAIGIFDHAPAGLTLWVQRTFPHPYDYPANKFKGGYPFVQLKPHYFLPEQHNSSNGTEQYTFYGMSDRLAIIDTFSATGQASPIPLNNWTLSPLSCISQLGSEHVEDPANRNRRGRQPTIADKLLKPILPRAPRGPPGGKPRSKK